ncbi:MAG: ABC-F family ATP-binding cassette domain-containing protein [Bacteroidia bacterium]|nr:ABC-F family ATP-binding cassette domain-containing protein [Bacteroidia bacterium]
MVTIDNIGIEIAGRWLLRNASYQFQAGDRVGLIGRNGAGKSTLLRIINGDRSATEGRIAKAGDVKIAFFNQDLLSYETDRAIEDVVRDAFEPVLALQREINELFERLETDGGDGDAWDRLVTLQDEFETRGGTRIDAEVHSVLSGLGFKAEEHSQPYRIFSGGWRMRVLLARMLLTQPDLLLLDEPTNHLDLPSIQWLENYLKTFRGACVIVSHDRWFLNRIVNKILEISLQQMHIYAGNYEFYLAERALRMDLHQKAFDNQQKYLADQERFIERFRSKASKARQVQSKIKQLDKVDIIQAPEEDRVTLNFRFKMRTPSGREVLHLSGVSKAFGPKVVLKDTEATVMRGDKIALIGANGLGKSTLLRIVAGTEQFEGQRKEGHNVTLGFFAQHQLESLNLKRTILEEVSWGIADKTEAELRTLLGCFMFSGEDVDKKIQVLSGGERSRVALVKTLLSEANCVLLDEPTNHLDIPSIGILVEAIRAYEGTCLIVSHDRFFLQQVANKIWYIEDRQVKEYPGTYQEYADWKAEQEAEKNPATPRQRPSAKPVAAEVNTAAPPVNDYQQQKALRNKLRKLQRDQEVVEHEISQLEASQAAVIARLADPAVAADFQEVARLQAESVRLQEALDKAMTSWTANAAELESLGGVQEA